MSGVIDTNTVKMVLENSLFQKSAEETLSTLDKLKTALNFEGAVKGLENLEASIKNTTMDSLYNGVYKVQDSFSALDVVATRVLQNITDKVLSIGSDLLKKVTVEPLKSGLEEYETQINSVQTILSNTNDALIEQGMTSEHDRIEKVNSVLDDLNKYADMTIYNFTEMTRNIGTFTAAGVELDTAATSIKGIANLAAMSGSNSQQASTAMYQLSQAIAAGSVKLQDWNSVVNAGMGGKLFQNELIDTAKAMGVADEQFIALTEGATTFRESLSSGWISAEVLTNTLEKFTAGSEGYTKSQVEQMQQLWRARGYSEKQIEELTGSINQLTEEQEANLRTKWAEKGFSDEQIDHILSMGSAATDAATKVKTFSQLLETVGEALQSGWTQSWEYIIGDFEQAKMLWTEISDIMNLYIGKSADSRNKILEEWSKAAYSYGEAGELIRVADGSIVEGGKMIREEMGGRELIIQGLRNTFQGLFEVSLKLSDAWKNGFIKAGTDDSLSITGQKLKDLSLAFYDFTDNFKKSLVGENGPTELIKKLQEQFMKFATSAREAYDGVADGLSGIKNIFSSFFQSSFFSIEALNDLNKIFERITGTIANIGASIRSNFGDIGGNKENLITFFNGLYNALSTFEKIKFSFIEFAVNGIKTLIEYIIGYGSSGASILGNIGNALNDFANALNHIFNYENGASKFAGMFYRINESLKPFIDSIKNILSITTNGRDTGLKAFFDQFKMLSNGEVAGIDFFNMLEKSIQIVINAFKILTGVITPLFHAFTNVFGPSLITIVTYINELIDGIVSLTSSLIPNETAMTRMYTVFKGVYEVMRALGILIIETVKSAWEGLTHAIQQFLPSEESIATATDEIYKHLHNLSEVILGLATGEGGVGTLGDIIARLGDKLSGFIHTAKEIDPLEKLAFVFNKIADGIKTALGGSEDASLLDVLAEKLKKFLETIKEIFSDSNGNIDMVKVFEAGGIGVILKKLIDFIKDLKDKTSDLKGIFGFINDFKEIFEGLAESFSNAAKAESIKAIAMAMLEIAAAMFILSMIDVAALGKATVAMASMFNMIERVLVVLSTIDKGKVAAGAAAFASIGTAMLELAAAVYVLGSMDVKSVLQGLFSIALMLELMVAVVKQLSEIQGEMPKVVGTLIGLGIALNLLVIPIVALGNMDTINLAKGLVAVGLGLAALVGAAVALSEFVVGTDLAAAGLGLIEMSVAIRILASAINAVADLSWEQIAKGLVVMAAGLVAMVGAAAVVSKADLGEELMMLGASLIMLGVAMNLLAFAAKGIADVSWEDLGKMAAVLAGALIALGVASHLIDGKNLLMIGGAIFLVANAFLALNAALGLAQIIGPICSSISMAIEGFSSSLASFAHNASAKMFLDFLKDAILFLPQLAVGLALAIGEMIAALAQVAGKIVAALVDIGKAVLQGVAQLIPELFNVARTFFAELIPFLMEQIPAIFGVLTEFFGQLWGFLTAQIPNFFTFLGTLFEQIWGFLTAQVPNFFTFLSTVLQELLTFLMVNGPLVGATLLTLLNTLLLVIRTAIPEITGTLLSLLLELLTQLSEYVPQMAQKALEIIGGFLSAIAENIGSITESAITIAIAFMQGIGEKMPEIVDTAFKLIIGFIEGLAQAIENNHTALFDAVGHLIKAIVEAIIHGITDIAKGAGELIQGFISEFDAGKFATDLFNAGANLVQGIIDGITGWAQSLWDEAGKLAQGALNTITGAFDEHSPSKKGEIIGEFLAKGLAIGINNGSEEVNESSENMAYDALDSINEVFDSNDTSYSPTISPVIDDSGLQNGINGYLGDVNNTITGTASITGTLEASNRMKTQMAELMSKENDYSSIISGMNELRGELSQYNKNVTNMQVVMDNGVLVGQLTPGIDSGLGRASILARRGV